VLMNGMSVLCVFVVTLCVDKMLIKRFDTTEDRTKEEGKKRQNHWQKMSNVPAQIHAYQLASDCRVFPVWAHQAMQRHRRPYLSICI
jgi:hypothetical protein